MNKTFKLALFLGVVAAISGLVLGFVNSVTAPVIEANAIKAEKANLEVMYPGADFKILDYADSDGIITGAYKVNGSSFIFKGTATGYNSSTPIIVLVGITKDGKVDKLVALQQQETSNFGARCFEADNVKKLYLNKTSAEEVDMLAGATFTSTAMKNILTEAFEAYGKVK